MYISTKTYGHDIGLSACFRQWRAKSHCRHLHGYALKIHFEFGAEDLDEQNWVMDFGALKPLKAMLEDMFDHTLLIAADDPMRELLMQLGAGPDLAKPIIVPATGCEAFAELIHGCAEQWLADAGYAPRVRLLSVQVAEHGANSAIYKPDAVQGDPQ